MNGPEELAAIRRCKTGDKVAFRLLAERYENILFGIAYLMTHNRDAAADAVQEAFLKMWKYIPSLRDENGLKAWLVRILINEVKQQKRKKHLPTIPFDQVSENTCGNDIQTDIERNELQETVRKAVHMLVDDQKQVVVLHYFGGLTIAEIAVAMKCRKGTIKSRLSRALKHLAVILDENKAIGFREEMGR